MDNRKTLFRRAFRGRYATAPYMGGARRIALKHRKAHAIEPRVYRKDTHR